MQALAQALADEARKRLLALNPFDGFFFYVSKMTASRHSAPHSVGKITAKTLLKDPVARAGSVQAFAIDREQRPTDLHEVYNREEPFHWLCWDKMTLGYARPHLVIRSSRVEAGGADQARVVGSPSALATAAVRQNRVCRRCRISGSRNPVPPAPYCCPHADGDVAPCAR